VRSISREGRFKGKQRYKCKECGKTFSEGVHSLKKKDFAIFLYINGNGIRQISRIVKVAPSVVLRWIRMAHENMRYMLKRLSEGRKKRIDEIELDEIYTYVKKTSEGSYMDCL
jgi:transposase-like protein